MTKTECTYSCMFCPYTTTIFVETGNEPRLSCRRCGSSMNISSAVYNSKSVSRRYAAMTVDGLSVVTIVGQDETTGEDGWYKYFDIDLGDVRSSLEVGRRIVDLLNQQEIEIEEKGYRNKGLPTKAYPSHINLELIRQKLEQGKIQLIRVDEYDQHGVGCNIFLSE